MAEHDEGLVERAAEALFGWNTPNDPYFVIRGRFGDTSEGDPYAPIVRAVLDAVTPAIEARALREAADEIDGECPGVGAALVHPWMAIARSWLHSRADRIEGA